MFMQFILCIFEASRTLSNSYLESYPILMVYSKLECFKGEKYQQQTKHFTLSFSSGHIQQFF